MEKTVFLGLILLVVTYGTLPPPPKHQTNVDHNEKTLSEAQLNKETQERYSELIHPPVINPPFQILRPNADHSGLEIVEESLALLSGVSEPISIIGVIGPYHGGKSFLLNTLTEETRGFIVGPTTNTQTAGVWLRRTNLTGKDFSTIYLLDTEGFFANNVDETYDAKVFALTTLLSSHVIYNSIKIIDQAAVDYLELLSRRTQLFQFKMSKTNDSVPEDFQEVLRAASFPSLTWVVRDFAQRLTGSSANDYLNQYIHGTRDKNLEGNEIDKIFKTINCYTLPLPLSTDPSRLTDVSELKYSELGKTYQHQVWELREKLVDNIEAKSTQFSKFNGPILAALIKFLATAVDDNRLGQLPSLWNSWLSLQTESARVEAKMYFEKLLESSLHADTPEAEGTFLEKLRHARNHTLTFYKDSLFNHEKAYRSGLNDLTAYLEEKGNTFRDRLLYLTRNIISKYREELSQLSIVSLQEKLSPTEIVNKTAEILHDVEHKFHERFSKYANSSIYASELQALKTRIEGVKDAAKVKSLELLGGYLARAEEVYKSTYADALSKAVVPMDAPLLEEFNKRGLENAANAFAGMIPDEKFRNEEIYVVRLAELQQRTGPTFYELFEKNELAIEERAQIVVNKYADEFAVKVHAIKLPQEQTTLLTLTADIAVEYLNDYAEQLQEFRNSNAYEHKKSELKKEFHKEEKLLFNRNTDLIEQLSADVFECAHQKVESKRCTFCLSNLVPMVHRSETYNAVMECFDAKEPQMSFKLSQALKDDVFNSWYDHKDRADAREVTNHFLVFASCATLALGWAIYEIMKGLKVIDHKPRHAARASTESLEQHQRVQEHQEQQVHHNNNNGNGHKNKRKSKSPSKQSHNEDQQTTNHAD